MCCWKKDLDPNITGPKAKTPLHIAAQINRPELVDLLLSAQVSATRGVAKCAFRRSLFECTSNFTSLGKCCDLGQIDCSANGQ